MRGQKIYSFIKAITLLLVCFVTLSGSRIAPAKVDLSKVYGIAYIEKTKSFAQYKVFVAGSESVADLKVYKVGTGSEANKSGLWHQTTSKDVKAFSVYFVESRNDADFSIYYVSNSSIAGPPS